MTEQLNTKKELLRSIRQGRIHPERSREPWSNEERDELIELHRDGIGISDIALRLQRSEQAVVQQLTALDVFTPVGSTRKRSTKRPQCLCRKCKLSKSKRPRLQEGGDCPHAGKVG